VHGTGQGAGEGTHRDFGHLRPPGGWLTLLPAVAVAVAVAVAAAGVDGLLTPTELRMAEVEPLNGGVMAGAGVLTFCVPLPAVQAQAPSTAHNKGVGSDQLTK